MEWWFLCASPFQMRLSMGVLLSLFHRLCDVCMRLKNWLVYCSLSLSQSIYIHRSLDQEDPYLDLIYNTRPQSLSLIRLDKTFEGFWMGWGWVLLCMREKFVLLWPTGPLWPGIVCSMSPKESYTTLWRSHNAKHYDMHCLQFCSLLQMQTQIECLFCTLNVYYCLFRSTNRLVKYIFLFQDVSLIWNISNDLVLSTSTLTI